jgi:hypothetical protein
MSSMGLFLRKLQPSATYQVKHIEQNSTFTRTGQQLMTDGIAVSITTPPEAATVVYTRLP